MDNNPTSVDDEICTKHDQDCKEKLLDPIVEKCIKAFSLLWPDEDVIIHKEKIVALMKIVLGDIYNDAISNLFIDSMVPNKEGFITLENFFQAFSLDCWSQESLAIMQQISSKWPDIVTRLTDWKSILTALGCDAEDIELQSLIEKAHDCAKNFFNLELFNVDCNIKDQEELKKLTEHIVEYLSNKLGQISINKANEEVNEINDNVIDEVKLDEVNDEKETSDQNNNVNANEN